MLNRFVKAKQDATKSAPEKRPIFAHEVTNIHEAQRWRQQIIREVGKEVSIIQDGTIETSTTTRFANSSIVTAPIVHAISPP